MNFVLTHLADTLVLLKEYESGCKALSWLINGHLRRVADLVDDADIRKLLRSVNVENSENIEVIEKVYRELALKELQTNGESSPTNSKLLLEEETEEETEEEPVDEIEEIKEEIEFNFEKI